MSKTHREFMEARWNKAESSGSGATLFCHKCQTEKPLSGFYWYRATCRSCTREKAGKWYLENRDKSDATKKEWSKLNKDKVKSYRDKSKKKNAANVREGNRLYVNRRLLSDPGFKLLHCMRKRVRKAMRFFPKRKTESTIALLGCSASELKKEMLEMLSLGMTWSNYGSGSNRWSIDHIIPCAAFDLSKESHQKACFNVSNLQPMWNIDNSKKSDSTSRYQRAFIEGLT